MNWGSWLLWGFVANMVLTTLMAASQGFGLTRINIPYMLGTMFTPSRDRAKLVGFLFHLLNGWLFSLVYVGAFQLWGEATWWRGALAGIIHAGIMLTVGMRLIPTVHPRMASEHQGPTLVRQLEPPGFLALNYGYQTPLYAFIAHIVFGIILGSFYSLR